MTSEATNKQATKELLLRMRTLTPRQWQRARTVLDMSREEIMNDEAFLFCVAAWHKEGAKDLEVYMDKTEEELQTLLGFDLSEIEATVDAALEATDSDAK